MSQAALSGRPRFSPVGTASRDERVHPASPAVSNSSAWIVFASLNVLIVYFPVLEEPAAVAAGAEPAAPRVRDGSATASATCSSMPRITAPL